MMLQRTWVACLLLYSLAACNRSHKDYSAYINDPVLYCKTVKQLNNVVLENNFPAMVASRNYVYANIAAFEVVAAFDKRFRSLSGQIIHLPAPPVFDTAGVNYQLAALLAFCKVGEAVTFSEENMQEYVNRLKKEARQAGIPASMISASQEFADSMGNHILAWSKGDHYARLRTAPKYNIVDMPGRWVPTPPMYAQAVEPHWMEMRPMVMDSASQFRPVLPPVFDISNQNSTYYRALLEVKHTVDSLTDEQKHIADFWDDNPFTMNVSGHVMFATKKFSPPGHWMNIVGIGALKAGADFSTTVAAYAETAIGLYDAFISCWDEKYRSNYVRPETVISKYISPGWQPYIQTPPFPSYTSGHATNSACAAEIMTYWFGDKLSFTDTSLLEFGIRNREIRSFRDAAKEAALSRLYGGIHYRFDNENGTEAGTRLGQFIVNRLKLKN